MDVVELIGRVIFVAIFLNSGIGHFRQREGMVAYARAVGAPAPPFFVPASGLLILAGGLMVAVGAWADLGALLLVAFLVPTAFFMHAFWRVDDPQMRVNQQTHFLKNLSMAGASLALFALYVQCGSDLLMPTNPLFA
jgi:uncharacterized membrane protein YphA (DoxX/SURF4 family)